jgi:hypothetical protein
MDTKTEWRASKRLFAKLRLSTNANQLRSPLNLFTFPRQISYARFYSATARSTSLSVQCLIPDKEFNLRTLTMSTGANTSISPLKRPYLVNLAVKIRYKPNKSRFLKLRTCFSTTSTAGRC